MKKIGLDAGHGLKTPGKQTPDGVKEWSLNDKVRDKIVNILKVYDVEFILTDKDEGNTDESLTSRRTSYVNQDVDVFVSIHHNAFTGKWNDATGVEVFVDKNYTESDMKLAELIYKNLPGYTGLKGRGIKKENWTVINQNKVPAVLVEGGFMDSRIDNPVITSDKGQDAYARAVAEALIAFLGLKKKEEPKAEEPKENTSTGYLVRVKSPDGELNVRKEPTVNSDIETVIKNGEVYTIVGEKNGLGKLKSGAGWIKLSYTEKVNKTSTPSIPKPVTKNLAVGCKVKIKLKAKKYCTGQEIPNSVKKRSHTVKQIGCSRYPTGVLLKEIYSWVNRSDIEIL